MLDPQMRANAILQLRARERGGAGGAVITRWVSARKGRPREWAEMLSAFKRKLYEVCALLEAIRPHTYSVATFAHYRFLAARS